MNPTTGALYQSMDAAIAAGEDPANLTAISEEALDNLRRQLAPGRPLNRDRRPPAPTTAAELAAVLKAEEKRARRAGQ